MIITIARQCGSGGHEIGKELASRLGLELYDRKKLEEEAKKLGKLDENKEFFQEKAVNSLLYLSLIHILQYLSQLLLHHRSWAGGFLVVVCSYHMVFHHLIPVSYTHLECLIKISLFCCL